MFLFTDIRLAEYFLQRAFFVTHAIDALLLQRAVFLYLQFYEFELLLADKVDVQEVWEYLLSLRRDDALFTARLNKNLRVKIKDVSGHLEALIMNRLRGRISIEFIFTSGASFVHFFGLARFLSLPVLARWSAIGPRTALNVVSEWNKEISACDEDKGLTVLLGIVCFLAIVDLDHFFILLADEHTWRVSEDQDQLIENDIRVYLIHIRRDIIMGFDRDLLELQTVYVLGEVGLQVAI